MLDFHLQRIVAGAIDAFILPDGAERRESPRLNLSRRQHYAPRRRDVVNGLFALAVADIQMPGAIAYVADRHGRAGAQGSLHAEIPLIGNWKFAVRLRTVGVTRRRGI